MWIVTSRKKKNAVERSTGCDDFTHVTEEAVLTFVSSLATSRRSDSRPPCRNESEVERAT